MSEELMDANWSQQRACALRAQIELISEIELSLMLDEPLTKVKWRRANGVGPRYVKLGRSVFYTLSDIRDWIEDNTHPASPKKPEDKDVPIFAS